MREFAPLAFVLLALGGSAAAADQTASAAGNEGATVERAPSEARLTATFPTVVVSQLPPRLPPQPPSDPNPPPPTPPEPKDKLVEIVDKLIAVVEQLDGRLETVERELAAAKARLAALEAEAGPGDGP